MDSATVTRLITEALKLSPNDPKSNGYGLALGVVIALGVFCIGGFVVALKRYERYRDRQDAANELRWKEENAARNQARSDFSLQIDARFDKLERVTDEAFDSIEVEAKAVSERYAALDKRLARLEWANDAQSKNKGG